MRLVIFAAVATSLLAVVGAAQQTPVVSVSSDPTGLTVESQKTGRKMIPGIDIYASGAVAVRRYNGSEAAKRIDVGVVDRLVASLERTKFYKVTDDSFHAEVDASQRPGTTERIIITDCPIWTISVRHERTIHSTTFYGLWEMSEHYRKSKQLELLKDAIVKVYAAVGEKVYD
jgi:hypothetical protein